MAELNGQDYINFKTKDKDFNLLSYMAGN